MQKSILSMTIGLVILGLTQAAFAGQTNRTGPNGNTETTTRTYGDGQQTTTRTGPKGNTETTNRTYGDGQQTTTRTGPKGKTQTTTRNYGK